MEQLERLPLPLLLWFRENARTLPWRSDPTPYHVWVSEIMLQQTRVAAVLGYYTRFLEVLPTVEDLARCSEDRLMKLWQGLGYYSRARNLQKAARQVMDEFGGEFPSHYEDIRSLAGVGDYTAGAIASIAFGQPIPAVDGNVLRVVSRFTGDGRDVTRTQVKEEIRTDLEKVIPKDMPGDFNQAMMDLGATVCLPNGAPLCESCPVAEFCQGYLEGRARDLPVKPPKKERKMEERVVYIILRNGRVALRRRPERGLLAGLWEYPNELSPWPCPVKGRTEFVGVGKHIFTHKEWRMTAYTVAAEGEALPPGWVWADREEWEKTYALPSAFACFVHVVERKWEETKQGKG